MGGGLAVVQGLPGLGTGQGVGRSLVAAGLQVHPGKLAPRREGDRPRLSLALRFPRRFLGEDCAPQGAEGLLHRGGDGGPGGGQRELPHPVPGAEHRQGVHQLAEAIGAVILLPGGLGLDEGQGLAVQLVDGHAGLPLHKAQLRGELLQHRPGVGRAEDKDILFPGRRQLFLCLSARVQHHGQIARPKQGEEHGADGEKRDLLFHVVPS